MRWYQGTDSTYVQMLLQLKIRYMYTVHNYSTRLDIQLKESARESEKEERERERKAERFLSSLSREYIFLLACFRDIVKCGRKFWALCVCRTDKEHRVEY